MTLFRHLRPVLLLLPLLLASFAFAACSGGINSGTNINDRFNDATIKPLGLATVTASCKPGEQMVSGGWALNPSAYNQDTVSLGGVPPHLVIDEYFIAASYPSSANSWSVTFTNQTAGANAGDILGIVHVECLAKGKAPTIVSQSGNSSSGNSLTTQCPSGTQVTSGGYKLDNITQANIASTIIDFTSSSPVGLTGWKLTTDYSIGNLNLFGNNATVYGVCASGLNVSAGSVSTVSVPAGNKPETATNGSGSAACSTGETPIGAGYQKASPAWPRAFPITSFFPSYGSSPQTWNATAYALPPIGFDSATTNTGGNLKLLPLCANIGG